MTYGNYPDLSKVKKILVVKLRHHGDVLLTSPLFSHLRKVLPDVQIDAYVYKDTHPMLEGHPGINTFFHYDKSWKKLSFFKKIAKEVQMLRKMRRERYDMVINLTEGDRGALIAKICRPRYSIGMQREGKKNSYSHVVKSYSMPRHTVEKQLDALRCIGLFPSEEDRELYFHISEEAKDRAFMLTDGLKDYVVVHPVSRWRFKCPPPHIVASVVKDLILRGKKVVFTSGPDKLEVDIVASIIALLPKEAIIDLSGKTSLKELGAVIKRSQMLFCVDSVPLHMASALKTPVVVLFGPTSEVNWGPWMHPYSRVVTKNVPCRPCFKDGCAGSKMSDCLHFISPKVIINSINSLLEEVYGE